MKIKFTLTLSLCLLITLVKAQTQIAINKKPGFYSATPSNSIFSTTIKVPNYGIAMVVKPSKGDFGITMIDENAQQNWIKELDGFPLAIGYFKKSLVVVSASEKTFFSGISSTYIARILDPKNGNVLKEKTIYEGSKDFMEDSKFFFTNDGSQFTFIARQTNLRKGLRVGIIPLKDYTGEAKADFRVTKNYSIISYDENLMPANLFTPKLPTNQVFQDFTTENGNLIIASYDSRTSNISFELYDTSKGNVMAKANLKTNGSIDFYTAEFKLKYSDVTKNYYFCAFNEISKKQKNILIGKIDFTTGKVVTKEEFFDKDVLKNIDKSHVVVNKKLDDYKLNDLYYFNLQDFKIVNDKVAVELTASYLTVTSNQRYVSTQSTLIKFYDQDLEFKFNSTFPRFMYSTFGEGTDLKYTTTKNILTIFGNTKDGQATFIPVRMKIDLNTGTALFYDKLPTKDIDNAFYISVQGLNSFTESKVLIPYVERFGPFKNKYDLILQVVDLE